MEREQRMRTDVRRMTERLTRGRARPVQPGTDPLLDLRVWVVAIAAVGLSVWICLLPALLAADGAGPAEILAWTLLDLCELGCLAALAVAHVGGLSPRRRLVARLTGLGAALLLVADAGVDLLASTVLSSGSVAQWGTALAMALLVELPLAAVCTSLAIAQSAPRSAHALANSAPSRALWRTRAMLVARLAPSVRSTIRASR